jgi:hypothetical protein
MLPNLRRHPSARGSPNAECHPRHRRGSPAKGADDRPSGPSVRGRRVRGHARPGVPGERALARRRRLGIDRHERRVWPPVVDLWRRVAPDRTCRRPPANHARARVSAPVRPDPWQRRPDPVADRIRGRRRNPGLALRASRGCPAGRSRGYRVLPRLPALLPALVGARSRHPDLDRRRSATLASPRRPGPDPLPLTINAGPAARPAWRRGPWRGPRPPPRRVRPRSHGSRTGGGPRWHRPRASR